jgi:acyl-CoA hydrolase/GNAT superfamily N-acetyltransferase
MCDVRIALYMLKATGTGGRGTGDKDSAMNTMGLPAAIQEKLITAEQAASFVKPGDHVFVGTACATPRVLTKALEESVKPLSDVVMFHFLTDGAIPRKDGIQETRFHHRSFFVGTDERAAMRQGKLDYVPISIAQVPSLLENGRIRIDVALIQVSFPEEHGFVSLGVSVDITKAVVRKAKTVIAELNPHMPCPNGEAFLGPGTIDHFVPVDTPVIEYVHPPVVDAVAEQIAHYVARIIDDGSTLQIGLGRIPNHMLKFLTNRRDLGIHSDVITDSIIDLVERGVITGKAKSIHHDQIVTSYCVGTRRLYDLIHRNPLFAFFPLEYVCHPSVLARNTRLVSVTQAFAADLTGQICADQFEGEFYGGVSTQPDFLRAAAVSPHGKPIICLPSTTEDGKTSRIRPLLQSGEGATVCRSDVHYVITEYGMAYLFGKSIKERALAMIEIAHPSFRSWLLDEAKKLGYVRPDQGLKSRVAYPVREEREITLKNGRRVTIRPSRASDVKQLQDVFYRLSEEDVYTRFFRQLESLSVSEAEHLCNVDYETEMAFVALAGEREDEQIIAGSCYFLNPTTNIAEVAYMVLPEWQSSGVGGALQERMTEYAKKKGCSGFVAEILSSNSKMIALARKAGEQVDIRRDGGTCEVTVLF